jgi:N-acetylglucosaminyldiphosphoundecaprenol N-acetyl-beta-D-mannosaminyltransferase
MPNEQRLSPAPHANILGVGVSAVTMNSAIAHIRDWIDTGKKHFVCVTSVHGIMECQSSPRLRQAHEDAGLVVPDGMPIVWMAQRLGHRHTRQVYGPSLMRELSAATADGTVRHFYYGGAPGVADQLRNEMIRQHPKLNIVGTFCPPFRPLTPEEDADVIARINAAAPDIVWVGLSTPKQEMWMHAHAGALNASVLIGVGAAFDFLSGQKRQPPLWIQKTPLQWLFRLVCEPRRLWRRYVWIVPAFMWRAGLQLVREQTASR